METKKLVSNSVCTLIVAILLLALPAVTLAQESEQKPEQEIEHESGLYYTIKKGDTLWDISQHFNDSPYLWPELWKDNDQITNPHWIYPGERIRLYHKKDYEKYVKKNKGTASITDEADESTEMLDDNRPHYYFSKIDGVGFIRKEAVNPLGYIFKSKDDRVTLSLGHQIYIRPTEGVELALGNKYTIYRTLAPTMGAKKKQEVGVQHYLTGVVEITNVRSNFAVGRIVRMYRSIEVNDLIMPYQTRSPKIPLMESVEGLKGQIIVSEDHKVIIGDYHVAFIDKGKQDGVRNGQTYTIYYQEKEVIKIPDKDKEEVLLTPVEYGSFLVLHTEDTTATVLITRSEQDINPGAMFYAPQ